MENKIKLINVSKQQYITDAAFQVLTTVINENRTILVCWNGKPFGEEFLCETSFINYEIIAKALERSRARHCYSNEHIRMLHRSKKLFLINVYGSHLTVANRLVPMDFIVCYNILIKPDYLRVGRYSYIMYDGNSYGKMIRVCGPKSLIGMCEFVNFIINFFL